MRCGGLYSFPFSGFAACLCTNSTDWSALRHRVTAPKGVSTTSEANARSDADSRNDEPPIRARRVMERAGEDMLDACVRVSSRCRVVGAELSWDAALACAVRESRAAAAAAAAANVTTDHVDTPKQTSTHEQPRTQMSSDATHSAAAPAAATSPSAADDAAAAAAPARKRQRHRGGKGKGRAAASASASASAASGSLSPQSAASSQSSHSSRGGQAPSHGDGGHSHSHDGAPCGGHGGDSAGAVDHARVPAEDMSEAVHYTDVLFHFNSYATHSFQRLDRMNADFHSIPSVLQATVPGWEARMVALRNAIRANHEFLAEIVAHRYIFQTTEEIDYEALEIKADRTSVVDEERMSKVRSTLRQCVRDWSAEGAAERDACYGPILRELERLYPDRAARKDVRVLVPGSGLGRLVWEVAARGFFSQGNEVHMTPEEQSITVIEERQRSAEAHSLSLRDSFSFPISCFCAAF